MARVWALRDGGGERRRRWAVYSAYPTDRPGEALDLACPGCGSDEIEIVAELADPGSRLMLGDGARCWTCKLEFTVTENRWKPRNLTGI